jgi:hypothetical protein
MTKYVEAIAFGLTETRFNQMRDDQITFANHLLSSWGHRAWPTGKAITCRGNYHVPIVRYAIKVAIERRP